MKDTRAMQKDDDQEMSMEEILASIRKYVTDDGSSPATSPSSTPTPTSANPPATRPPEQQRAEEEEEEVLDLKKVHNITEHPRHEAVSPAPQQTPPVQSQPAPSIAPSYPTYAAAPVAQAPVQSIDPISSGKTMTSSAQALSRLVEAAKVAKEPEPFAPIAGGATIDQLAIQALTPLLKQWMDANLSILVERLVQKEIENITAELLKKK